MGKRRLIYRELQAKAGTRKIFEDKSRIGKRRGEMPNEAVCLR